MYVDFFLFSYILPRSAVEANCVFDYLSRKNFKLEKLLILNFYG